MSTTLAEAYELLQEWAGPNMARTHDVKLVCDDGENGRELWVYAGRGSEPRCVVPFLSDAPDGDLLAQLETLKAA